MTKQLQKQSSTYRLSDAFIKLWTRILVTILCVGIGAGMAVMIYLLVVYGDVATEDLPSWAVPSLVILFGAGFGIPLILGAILGGIAINKYAWIPLLFVVGGLLAIGVSAVDGYEFLAPYAIASMVLGGISVFIIALGFTKVPVWVQLPILKSPRASVRKNNTKKKK